MLRRRTVGIARTSWAARTFLIAGRSPRTVPRARIPVYGDAANCRETLLRQLSFVFPQATENLAAAAFNPRAKRIDMTCLPEGLRLRDLWRRKPQ